MKSRILALLVVAASFQSQANAGVAADPLKFLFLDSNSRAVALGGAYTALANDSSALHYNPAGLARATGHSASFMHNQYFESVSQEQMAYASPWGAGIGLNYVDYGSTQRTTLSNPSGTGLGSVAMSDLSVSVGYARSIFPGLSIGLAEKFIEETIAGVSAEGYATDVGIAFSPAEIRHLKTGVAIQNIGPTIKFKNAEESLPLNLRLGAAYDASDNPNGFILTADISRERREDFLFGVGIESRVIQTMPIRLGYNSRIDAGPGITAGIGWDFKRGSVDYSIVPFGDLGVAHRISLSWRWGRKSSTPSAPNSEANQTP